MLGAVAGLGLLAGPVLAGLCLDLFGWRSFFYLRIPFAVISLVMAQVFLKKESVRKNRERFDLAGALLFFLALLFLFFVLTQGRRLGWISPWILILGGVGTLLLISFLLLEGRTTHPVLDLSIFKKRLFSVAVVSHIFFYVSTVAVNFAMPFYLIGGLGFNASVTGLLLVTTPALALVVSPLSGKLSDRLGTLVLCASGLALNALGLYLLTGVTAGTSMGGIVFYLMILGVGMGLFVSPNTSAIIGAVPLESLGSASAMAGTLRHLGMSIGLAVSGTVFATSRFSHSSQLAVEGQPQDLVERLSTVSGFQDTMFVALIIGVAGFLASLFRGSIQQQEFQM